MKWNRTRLKYLAAVPITNGVGEPGTFDNPEWPRYVRTTDIAGPRALRTDVFASLPPEIAERALLRRGDIVMTAAGATVGKSLLFDSDEPACYAGYLARFRPSTGVEPRFVSYWTESTPYWDQITSGKVVSTIDNFSASKYQNLLIDVPALDVQQAIADYLDEETGRIDALRAHYADLVDGLLAWRVAITAAGVDGRYLAGPRRASGVPWLRELPARWGEVKLSLVARLGSGHTPSREHPEWWVDCTIPWITTGEVWQIRDDRIEYLSETRERIGEIGIANSSAELHPAGTVVLSRTASAGFSAIMAADMATSQDYVTWTCGPLLRPRFLLLCLRAMRRDLLGRLAMGSTHQTIYVPDIQSIRVPLPPIGEQDQVVDWVWVRLRRLDGAVDAIRKQTALMLARREALITAAVTGQLEIPGVAA